MWGFLTVLFSFFKDLIHSQMCGVNVEPEADSMLRPFLFPPVSILSIEVSTALGSVS